MKTIYILFISALIGGCSSTKFPPAFSFTLDKACTTSCKLVRHPASSISAKEGTVVRLSMENAYFSELYDKKPTEMGYSGRKELLIYAVIYKNGNFLKFSKITDIAEHMASYQPVVVQKPVFFTETIDTQYHIILKAYEVDTKTLAHSLRRIRNTDISAIDSTFYSPGTTFSTGFKDVVFGFFDMVTSLTGRSVDDWAAKASADKIFEHSIYIVPKTTALDSGSEKIVILGSGDSDFFILRSPTDKPKPVKPKDSANAATKAEYNAKVAEYNAKVAEYNKKTLKEKNTDIANYTKIKLDEIEAKPFDIEKFKKGKEEYFNGSSYVVISGDRLKK